MSGVISLSASSGSSGPCSAAFSLVGLVVSGMVVGSMDSGSGIWVG